MKHRKRRYHPFQAAPGRLPRPTCCANCQTLYDAVHASCAKATALGVAPDVDALYEGLRQPMPCLLCDRPEVTMGRLFLPHGGLWRGGGLLYFLCQACEMFPAVTRQLRVEAMIMAGLVGRRN